MDDNEDAGIGADAEIPAILAAAVRREVGSIKRTLDGDACQLEAATSRGITRQDCLDLIRTYDTDDPSGITQMFVRGQWGGFSVREALIFAVMTLKVMGDGQR